MQEPKHISQLWGSSCPSQVTILGSGPSLDAYHDERDISTVVAINDLVEHFPADYCVYGDPSTKYLQIPDEVVPIRWNRRDAKRFHQGRGYYWNLGVDIEAGTLGSVGVATILMAKWGVRRFRYFGIDSFGLDQPATHPRFTTRYVRQWRDGDGGTLTVDWTRYCRRVWRFGQRLREIIDEYKLEAWFVHLDGDDNAG